MVAVAVPYTEKALQEKLKAAGGQWDPEVRVWRVLYRSIRSEPVLVERIVREGEWVRGDRVSLENSRKSPIPVTGSKRSEQGQVTYTGNH